MFFLGKYSTTTTGEGGLVVRGAIDRRNRRQHIHTEGRCKCKLPVLAAELRGTCRHGSDGFGTSGASHNVHFSRFYVLIL